jgi:hypothetical protein
MNKVSLMGRLVTTPELKQTQSGNSVISFCVAVDRRFQGQDGKRETDFINCVAWRKTAEFIANANACDKVTWTFVAPDGKTYNEQEFVKLCGGGSVEGAGTGDLKIRNVNSVMNGWSVFATFDYMGASARSSTAYLYVWGTTGPQPMDEFYETSDVKEGDGMYVKPEERLNTWGK